MINPRQFLTVIFMKDSIFITTAFLASVLCGFIFIPVILNFCKEKRLYDIPDERKIHKTGIPRLGGISFLPSMLVAFLATTLSYNKFTDVSEVTFSLWSLYFFISLILIYGVGLVDDIAGLGAKVKFLVQIIAATLLPLSGLYINNLYGFMGVWEIPYYIGAPLTVFVIVFINNAINLIDGIDGLASGLSFIALTGFLICFMNEEMLLYAILIAGLQGVLISFMYYNIFGNPKKNRKIFMGDSGSLTLGFILGFLTVKYSMDNPNVRFWQPDYLLLSYTFMVVPVYDVVRVSLVRIRHKAPIFQADKNHIHHKLMRAGLSQRRALTTILVMALFFIGLNLLLNGIFSSTAIVAVDIVIWLIIDQFINMGIRRNGKLVYIRSDKNE
jgi:UDP-N-acetylmuramyl pentapeptide phosphotransferase/UDP-N-acetylglucosamine-1-phosphate transferase